MTTLSYFFRRPQAGYFSIEKLFHAIAREVKNKSGSVFSVREIDLPLTSRFATLLKNLRFVRREQTGVNHVTGDIHYTILSCRKKNVNILTIHDCVLLHRYPRTSPRHWIVLWLWYRLPVKRADAITVISENTQKDLLHFTAVAPEKVRIIPNFIDPAFEVRPKSFSAHKPRLLFIGTTPNKNLERTIDALDGIEAELLIVGYLTGAQAERLRIRKISYRLVNKLSDQEMRDVYAEADIMLFPSTYEGFGLPIIEAQATGRPVITSDLEPMKGVAGEGACLVNPFQAGSIREGISKTIESEAYRNMLIEKGFENVKRFQLSLVAAQYRDLYLELIKQKGI